jgi:hypothetical protein
MLLVSVGAIVMRKKEVSYIINIFLGLKSGVNFFGLIFWPKTDWAIL